MLSPSTGSARGLGQANPDLTKLFSCYFELSLLPPHLQSPFLNLHSLLRYFFLFYHLHSFQLLLSFDAPFAVSLFQSSNRTPFLEVQLYRLDPNRDLVCFTLTA